MSHEEQPPRSRTAIWVVVVCAAVVAATSIGVFQVPTGGLDQLVYDMRSAERTGLSAQLIRIALITAIFMIGWERMARWISSRFTLDAASVIAVKWRVFGWYLAFEAVLVINFIRIV